MENRQFIIPPQLENLLLEFTINVIVENPEDLISHAADYFTRMKNERDEGHSARDASGNKDDIKNILGPRSARRPSVMGERYNPEEDDISDIEVYPKSDEQINRIKDCVQDVFLFRALDEKDLSAVIDAMMPRSVNKGEVIIRQGDDGDFFYVVDKGCYDAYIKNDKGADVRIQTYENSGSFGELALLHNQPRAATVKATTDGFLWAVSRRSFNRLVVRRAFEKRKHYMKLLDIVPQLKPLTEYEKMQLCDSLSPISFKSGEVVFNEGDDADGMYFIEEGVISVSKASPKGKSPSEVAELSKGEYFGEMALVKKIPRSATITVVEDAKLAFLDVGAFERLLGPCIEIMKRHIDTYKDS
ncbi:cAMP-dependent protein kinase type II regulatory subunit-like [Stegodyphus dumicola]|uniref:cAMP-dependent protein kinase type II regulatory subunit-like n=1 Tax=Stegodyphus dumicola TaxID=202533 RepID=UPI0015B2A91D|nr:cAMP-dependent protein kinase type II regulatory subunit-like [Stegodyphus dumicola]